MDVNGKTARAKLFGGLAALLISLCVALGLMWVSTSALSADVAYGDPIIDTAYAVNTSQTAGGSATESNATHGESAEEGGIAAILPDMIEFIPMLIAFIVLWIILAKFGWPIFNNMLDKRETTIREALQKSEEAQIESERVLQEYKHQLADAKAQAAKIIADARSSADMVKKDITKKAQQEAADIIAKAKEAIEAEKKQALVDLQMSMADNAVDLATRLVSEGIDPDQQRRIIARYVNEAGSFNGN